MNGRDFIVKTVFWGSCAGLAVSLGVPFLTAATHASKPDKKVQFTVDDKTVKPGKDSGYLVFTKDEVFENSDSLFRGKWNSSDIQNQLKEGCTYEATVYGFRNHFLSAYRNIVQAKHIVTETCPTPKGPVAS